MILLEKILEVRSLYKFSRKSMKLSPAALFLEMEILGFVFSGCGAKHEFSNVELPPEYTPPEF